MNSMQQLKARVHNGRLVLDEPTDLPEGAEVEMVVVDGDFDPDERARLLAAIDEGVPAPVITAALNERFESRGLGLFTDKVLSAMRGEFGGHAEKQS